MITSRDNETVKKVIKLISSAKVRRENGLYPAEGVRLCRDAADSGAEITDFLFTPQAAEKYPEDHKRLQQLAERSSEISRDLYARLSDTNTPQGFLCLIRMKAPQSLEIRQGCCYTALENIQDPANMGTILRTAEALGIRGVILSPDCCDVYSPKVVRGSMGAVFRMPLWTVPEFTRWISEQTKAGIPTFAATPKNAMPLPRADFSQGGIMLIGNEGNGLREETIRACTHRVLIPMNGRAESLNASAAAAILMYEMIAGE